MKTSFLKKMIPVAFFALAIIGAFSTHAMEVNQKATTTHDGYIKLNPLGTECEISTMCSEIENQLCTVGGLPGNAQLWGKNANDRCVVELFRIQP
jgi:hypothetical protein